MPCFSGATVEESQQDQDENDIEDILDGSATKTVCGFISVQPKAEGTTIETTDVGFTFAGGETEAASTNIWIPHSESPQGISVQVVSNSTLCVSAPFHRDSSLPSHDRIVEVTFNFT